MYQCVGINVHTVNGKIEIKPRCELCKFVDINSDDLLICNHPKIANPDLGYIGVDDNGYCENFDISKQMMSDIVDGCVT